MISTLCPHCGHKIIIPNSVAHYICICGKEYKIIVKDESPRIKEQDRTTEGEKSSD